MHNQDTLSKSHVIYIILILFCYLFAEFAIETLMGGLPIITIESYVVDLRMVLLQPKKTVVFHFPWPVLKHKSFNKMIVC